MAYYTLPCGLCVHGKCESITGQINEQQIIKNASNRINPTTLGSRFANVELFFFFQAEDGIRDVAVTGVQTCALPIFPFQRTCRGSLFHGCSAVAMGIFGSELRIAVWYMSNGKKPMSLRRPMASPAI